MAAKLLYPGIVADPEIRGGKPVIKGTRMPVALVVAQVAATLSPEQVADDYDLTLDEVRAALGYAAMRLEKSRTSAKR